jgi:hypothetical protein
MIPIFALSTVLISLSLALSSLVIPFTGRRQILSSAPSDRLPQYPLHLAIQTAQLIIRPSLQFLPEKGIDAEQDRLFIGHADPALIEGSGIQDRSRSPLSTEHNH